MPASRKAREVTHSRNQRGASQSASHEDVRELVRLGEDVTRAAGEIGDDLAATAVVDAIVAGRPGE
jgi:hypothetical protein